MNIIIIKYVSCPADRDREAQMRKWSDRWTMAKRGPMADAELSEDQDDEGTQLRKVACKADYHA